LVKAIEKKLMGDTHRATECLYVLEFLRVVPGQLSSKRALRDIVRCYAMICPFFPNLEKHSITKFLDTTQGLPFKDSLLLKQELRAKDVPDRRGQSSNVYIPESTWDPWMKVVKDSGGHQEDAYPLEYQITTLPIIAKLYTEGVIAPHYRPAHECIGLALSVKDPFPCTRGKHDLYIDYNEEHMRHIPSHFVDPKYWPDLLSRAREFVTVNPSAKFSLLRIWSSPYFYPYMIGHGETREYSSFKDGKGRCWEWKFMSKDMPGSEMSVHFNIEKSLGKFESVWGKGKAKQVIARRDIVLVMGKTEEELLRWTMGVTFALQDRPWLREVDLWKSFVNVDIELLGQLDKWWFQ